MFILRQLCFFYFTKCAIEVEMVIEIQWQVMLPPGITVTTMLQRPAQFYYYLIAES